MSGDTVRAINTISTLVLAGVGYYSGFSRFTHGQYTPGFYAFQLDRAPDNESMRVVPFMDVTLATLVLIPQVRMAASAVSTAFFGISVALRFQADKSPVPDLGLLALGLITLWSSMASRRDRARK